MYLQRLLKLREYAPMMTGVLLIALGLVLPLGFDGSPRLIDLFSHWASSLLS